MKEALRRIDQEIGRFATGNWITVTGEFLALVGICLFWMHQDWPAVILLTLSFLTDRFDGSVSRYHESLRRAQGLSLLTEKEEEALGWWSTMNHRGETHLGKWLDPLVDKIRFIGLLWVLAQDIVPSEIILNLTTMAILLTIVRPVLRWLDLGDGASNIFGKIKAHVEVVSITVLVFTTRPLFGEINALQDVPLMNYFTFTLFSGCLILALISFTTHAYSGWLAYKAKHP